MREREAPRTEWLLNGTFYGSQAEYDEAFAAWRARRARLLALIDEETDQVVDASAST